MKKLHDMSFGKINTALILIFIIVFIVSLGIGHYVVSPDKIINIIFGKLFRFHITASPSEISVVLSIRLPRIIAAIMIGGALSVAGTVYQGLFHNPCVSPDLLGASSGAGFGAAIALLLSLNFLGISVLAFIMGLCAVFFVLFVSSVIGKGNNMVIVLVLTGMVVSSLFSAFTSLAKYVADPDSRLPEITFWLMGGLSSITTANLLMLFFPLAIGMIPLFLFRWKINVLSFGDEEAMSMGLDVNKYRICLILCSTLITSASVAVSGLIGWVGLVIPHIARIIVGPDNKRLLPVSLIVGAIFLIVVDDIARYALESEIPLGILTSIVGAPFFIFLMIKGKKVWW